MDKPEVKLIYNMDDDRHYIYIGEDYYADTQILDFAIIKYREAMDKVGLINSKG